MSTPVARKSWNVKSVGNQSGSSARCHEPSVPWHARIAAPEAFVTERERVAVAIASSGASVRSRIACQLMAGSESSSHSIVFHEAILTSATSLSCYHSSPTAERFKLAWLGLRA